MANIEPEEFMFAAIMYSMDQLIEENKNAAEKLADQGLFCGGCPMAQFETIESGAKAHGVDVDKLIKELNSNE